MRVVGLEALKNKLNEYVRLALGGETVLVTDRDVVVAELIPPRDGRALGVGDTHLAELVRTGILVPPMMASSEPPPRIPVASTAEILEEVARDRADR